MEILRNNLSEARSVIDRFLNDRDQLQNFQKAADILVEALQKGNKIISCGNGGSMSDAMHFAEELTGRFRDNRPAIPAIAISDPSYISCVSNDYGYEYVFSRFIEGLGNGGDVLLGISTSGNSQNVINAIEAAKKKGMKIIGLTGKSGGKMAALCDVEIRAPKSDYADRAQELHIKIIHSFIEYVEGAVNVSKK